MHIPNHTQISNDFIDYCIKGLSGTSTKVFLIIARKTIGWHKETDRISQTQIQDISGSSINAIKKSIQELINHNIIIQTRTGTGKNISTYFEINYDNISKNHVSKNNISDNNVSEIDTLSINNVSENDALNTNNISKIDTTKEKIKNNNIKINIADPEKLNNTLSKKSKSNKKEKGSPNPFHHNAVMMFARKYAAFHKNKYYWKKDTGEDFKHIKNILEILNNNMQDFEKIIDNALQDTYWQSRITPATLYSHINHFLNFKQKGATHVQKNYFKQNQGSSTTPHPIKYPSKIYDTMSEMQGDGKNSAY